MCSSDLAVALALQTGRIEELCVVAIRRRGARLRRRIMSIVRRFFVIAILAALFGPPSAYAQTTGSITGVVSDASGAVLPGVTVTVSGERLIGGPQTQISDTDGTYRFDRLVPGSYNVKFELQGFRSLDRPDVRISAAFVATINAKMEVGSLSETITVTGESPTVDVRSNVQQTVMP